MQFCGIDSKLYVELSGVVMAVWEMTKCNTTYSFYITFYLLLYKEFFSNCAGRKIFFPSVYFLLLSITIVLGKPTRSFGEIDQFGVSTSDKEGYER
jgi:hypothetical protein